MQPHPAPFSQPIIDRLWELFDGEQGVRALDPFAGTGRVLSLLPKRAKATLVEIEPRFVEEAWDEYILPNLADIHRRQIDFEYICADSAVWLRYNRRTYTHIITSPTYGNRMSDVYRGKPGVECRSYAQSNGGALDLSNSGRYKLGTVDYGIINHLVMSAAIKRLVPGGMVYLNVSDFYRTRKKGGSPERQSVVTYWYNLLFELGLHCVAIEPITTKRFTRGENRHRVPYEYIVIFEKE